MLRVQGRLMLEGRILLPDFTCDARPGEWTGLIGPSGAGKSTLLRLMAGLPTAAQLQGQIEGARPAALMAQEPGLLPWANLIENLLIGPRLRGEASRRSARIQLRAKALAALEDCGLAALAHRHPPALSGGQRQRLALARVLIEDRPLVLLDEPFSALDAGLRLRMQDLAAERLAGRQVVLVTHDPLEAARLCQRVYMVEPRGLRPVEMPADTPPRALDASSTKAAHASCLAALLAAPIRDDAGSDAAANWATDQGKGPSCAS